MLDEKMLAFHADLWIIILCYGVPEAVLFDMVKMGFPTGSVGGFGDGRRAVAFDGEIGDAQKYRHLVS